jgi:hypothetical protein
MPASATMAIIFNDFYSFAQNNHWTGCIWTSLIIQFSLEYVCK